MFTCAILIEDPDDPLHATIAKGTLRAIIREAELMVEEFIKLL